VIVIVIRRIDDLAVFRTLCSTGVGVVVIGVARRRSCLLVVSSRSVAYRIPIDRATIVDRTIDDVELISSGARR
jgi:hypothetical protein